MVDLSRRYMIGAVGALGVGLSSDAVARSRQPVVPKPAPAPSGPDTFGIDHMYYPGDAALRTLRQSYNYNIVCFYLSHAATGSDPSWSRKRRDMLAKQGWGFFPTYIGQQGVAPSLSDAKADAKHAGDLAEAAGFPAGTVLYLDVEDEHKGNASDPFLHYVQGWQDGVRSRGFYPGLYGPYRNVGWFTKLTSAVWTVELPFAKRLLPDKIKMLAYTGRSQSLVERLFNADPKLLGYDPTKDRYGILRPGCVATQYLFSVEFPDALDDHKKAVTVDLNNSLVHDPSNANEILKALKLRELI